MAEFQYHFKSKAKWLEWRSHWRSMYADLTVAIRHHKTQSRNPANNWERVKAAQSAFKRHQMVARSMMMSMEAAKEEHRVRRLVDDILNDLFGDTRNSGVIQVEPDTSPDQDTPPPAQGA